MRGREKRELIMRNQRCGSDLESIKEDRVMRGGVEQAEKPWERKKEFETVMKKT